jgi:hypothetical protein
MELANRRPGGDATKAYGWVGGSGWGVVSARVTTNLDSLAVPQPLIDRTLADMKTLAVSAGVSADGFQTFTSDFNTLRDGEQSLWAPETLSCSLQHPSACFVPQVDGGASILATVLRRRQNGRSSHRPSNE